MIFFAFPKRFDILNVQYLVRFKNQSDRKLFKTEDNMKNTKSLFGLTGIAVAALIISSSAQAQPRHHHGHLPHRDLFVALDIASLVADIFLPRPVVAAPTTSVVVPQTTYVTPPSIPQTTYVTPTVPQTTYVTPTAVTQPVVTQPVVTQPVVTQPVVTTSVVTTPVVTAPSTVVYTTGSSYYYPRYYPRYYTPRFYGGPRYIAPPPPHHGFHGGFHGGPRHHHGGPRH